MQSKLREKRRKVRKLKMACESQARDPVALSEGRPREGEDRNLLPGALRI